jgi:hypothetical protein
MQRRAPRLPVPWGQKWQKTAKNGRIWLNTAARGHEREQADYL